MKAIISCMQLEEYHYAVLFEDTYPVKRLAESTLYQGWQAGASELLTLARRRGLTVIRVETPLYDYVP